MRIVGGQVFNGQGFVSANVEIEDNRISDVQPFDGDNGWRVQDELDGADVVNATGCYVIPGLVDVHFHGAMGFDLCDGTSEAISAIAEYEASRGVTSICPATMTYPEEKLTEVMRGVAEARAAGPAETEAQLVGVNMEGPYIATAKIGAQNPSYVRCASFDELQRLQEVGDGAIKIVDIAPETEGALEFIRKASAAGVRISVAHTGATYNETVAAFEAGAKQVTHLFNAMPGLHHREPGPIAAAAEDDGVTPELITDGVHIHPAMIRLAFRIFGPERILLISDSMRATGLEDGEYDLGGQQVTVFGNTATLANGALAGSVTDLMGCLKFAVQEAGIPLPDAVLVATANPAKAIGIYEERGSIEPGKIADLVVLDEDLNLRTVILRGSFRQQT